MKFKCLMDIQQVNTGKVAAAQKKLLRTDVRFQVVKTTQDQQRLRSHLLLKLLMSINAHSLVHLETM